MERFGDEATGTQGWVILHKLNHRTLCGICEMSEIGYDSWAKRRPYFDTITKDDALRVAGKHNSVMPPTIVLRLSSESRGINHCLD